MVAVAGPASYGRGWVFFEPERRARLRVQYLVPPPIALRRPLGFAVAAVLCGSALVLTACGGKSAGNGSESTVQPPAQRRGCAYGGTKYADGDAFASTDGCNSCSCDDGSVACTEIGCDPGPGPAQPVISCDQVDIFYEQLLEDAKRCDPHDTDPCSYRVSSNLTCGCDTFVNPQKWNAGLAEAFATHSRVLNCSATCGMCGQPPLRGKCSIEGRCEDSAEPGPGPGCKVAGVVYADGSSGIPDPISCNLCSCNAGQLACTDQACPMPCPTGTKLATSCAQCGPTDACEVVEHACRAVCTDTCTAGVCVDGACLTGICG